MARRGSFGVGPQGPAGNSEGAAGGDLGGTFPNPTIMSTANVQGIIEAIRLDQMAAPTANVSLNTHKLTGVSNGTAATDAAAFGQIPTTLPPNGSATGDLTGTYPAPTLSATSNVNTIVRANRLDQMAAPSASISMNNQKLTGLANGSASADSATFGQIPVALPPNGAATGDLTGIYPAPTVAKVNGIAITGTPTYGASPSALTSTTAAWSVLPNFVSTGILTGGVMSQNASPTAFNITAGTGLVADYVTTPTLPVLTPVTINAQTVTLGASENTRVVNYWYADSSGNIHSQATPLDGPQRRANIQLGVTWSVVPTGALYNIMSAPIIESYPTDTLFGLFTNLGSFSVSGNIITANATSLSLDKSAGTQLSIGRNYSFNGINKPNLVTNPTDLLATFRYVTQTTSSQSGTRTTLDVANYDNAGTITALSANGHAAIHRIWLIPTGATGTQLVIQYGQVDYTSLALANAAVGQEAFVTNPDLIGSQACLIGYIAATKVATNLTNTSQAVFFKAAKFANP
jgi:hypothetical protein